MRRDYLDTVIIKLKNKLYDPDSPVVPLKSWVLGLGLLGLGAVYLQVCSPKVEVEKPQQASFSLDTVIPKGQSLVPIQVTNYESLDQIIGQYGVVDLIKTPLNPLEKPIRVAFAVKLVRSPQSPGHFSVLVPADEADKLAGHTGEFTVVVRNPKLLGTRFVKKKPKSERRKLIYDVE